MILLLTPLALEKKHLRLPPEFQVRVGGHGKVAMALATQSSIAELKPDLVILAGSAGALSPDLKPFDVVVAESTVEHDFKMKFIRRPLPEFVADPATLARFRSVEGLCEGLCFGKIASGDEDIVSTERARELFFETGALAVAWEGAGAARACLLSRTPFLEIRGISDLANESAQVDFSKQITGCMERIAWAICKVYSSQSRGS